MQSVFWYEYLPAIGLKLEEYQGYNPEVNPGIDNFFTTVSLRYGHRTSCGNELGGSDESEVGLLKNTEVIHAKASSSGMLQQ